MSKKQQIQDDHDSELLTLEDVVGGHLGEDEHLVPPEEAQRAQPDETEKDIVQGKGWAGSDPKQAESDEIEIAVKTPVLALRDVQRVFKQGEQDLNVLRSVNLALRPGEMVALVGPSGAGKSSLLHIAGLLEKATSGDVLIHGDSVGRMTDRQRTDLRRKEIGFVYQYHHLLPEFSALENVMLPQMVGKLSVKEARNRSRELLEMVGMAHRCDHRPAKLSGGEAQRVAIARALSNAPGILLADEPTGNLDEKTAEMVFSMLLKLVKGIGLAALVATHNLELAGRMDRVLILHDGQLKQLDPKDYA